MHRVLLLVALSFSFAFTGCQTGKRGGAGGGGGADSDYVTGTPLPDRQEGLSFLSPNVDRGQFSPVYFAYDSFQVGPGEQGKIDQVASFLQSSQATIIIAGFTDDRGTEEYNRGLGERRALSVREALIQAGADAGALQTVSFGEEMPADTGSGDSAWAKNRRAEFGVPR